MKKQHPSAYSLIQRRHYRKWDTFMLDTLTQIKIRGCISFVDGINGIDVFVINILFCNKVINLSKKEKNPKKSNQINFQKY